MEDLQLRKVVSQFNIKGTVSAITPLGNGLINDTYRVQTLEADAPDYVLQRINNSVFTDVEMLQRNIEAVTRHIRCRLEARQEPDIDRKVLQFVGTDAGKTYFEDTNHLFWRMSVFIPDACTYEAVNPQYSYDAGKAFGAFEAMLVDIPDTLGETIPDFHNMELRMRQLREAVAADARGRLKEVRPLVDEMEAHAEEMCMAERLFREGKLKKRICHCDTKVNNLMYDGDGSALCVIDLDTVMPSFIFSDYGDFMRTAGNTLPEDDPHIDQVALRFDIFEAFTRGYLEGAQSFLDDIEIRLLPYAAQLFPFMQAVRFLTDYINGDTYYKTQYAEHNLVRTRNQMALYHSMCDYEQQMREKIDELVEALR